MGEISPSINLVGAECPEDRGMVPGGSGHGTRSISEWYLEDRGKMPGASVNGTWRIGAKCTEDRGL
jgi:hypothetical protein